VSPDLKAVSIPAAAGLARAAWPAGGPKMSVVPNSPYVTFVHTPEQHRRNHNRTVSGSHR
jgi:hypothetical protein